MALIAAPSADAGVNCGGSYGHQYGAVDSGHGTVLGTGTNTNAASHWSVPYGSSDFSLENTFVVNYNLDGTSVEAGYWTGRTDFGFETNLIPYSQTQDGNAGHRWGSTSIASGDHVWMAENSAASGITSYAQVEWSGGNFVVSYGGYVVNPPRLNHAQGEAYDDPSLKSAAWIGQGGNYPNGVQFLLYWLGPNGGAWNYWGEMVNPCSDPGYWVYEVPGTADEYRNGGWPAAPPPPG